ncbi:MAG: FKBP-type peptidyl-prolyl cis-trans isomerase [Phycisphaeraceae bacterium]|nr:FKBP-type peptidyl-prolyl cis-trans isomerase [Phycisphaeraceae bacterium]
MSAKKPKKSSGGSPSAQSAAPPAFPTASGVVIEDVIVGDGPGVPVGGAVVAHYRGTLKDGGAEFDSSHKRGEPAVFPLAGVIKGWQEGVPGMQRGGKRRLTIPAAAGYGSRSIPGPGGKALIPANSDLVFEIEIVNFLIIEEIKVGTGKVVPTDMYQPATVEVHYVGTLKDSGKKFDSSIDRDEPIEFALDEVIPGWTYGVPGMRVGGKRRLTIPWQMAYGADGSPPDIPGKADLVFEIELLGVK